MVTISHLFHFFCSSSEEWWGIICAHGFPSFNPTAASQCHSLSCPHLPCHCRDSCHTLSSQPCGGARQLWVCGLHGGCGICFYYYISGVFFFLHQTMSNLNFLLIICLSRLRSSFCPVVMFAAVWCAAMQCRGVLCVAAAYCSVFVFTMAKTRVNINILILLCIYASYTKVAVSSPYYSKDLSHITPIKTVLCVCCLNYF